MRVASTPDSNNAAFDRYKDSLANIPPSGGGGCHPALLSVANRGRIASVSSDQVAEDLRAHVHGTRKIPSAEIEAAVNKAFNTDPNVALRNTAPQLSVDGAKLLNAIFERGAGFHKKLDLCEASPVEIIWPPETDAIEVMQRLYAPTDRLFIGARHDASAARVLPASQWIKRFERGVEIPAHVIPNPLTGRLGETKDGNLSYRADRCVEQFRIAVVEFDLMPLEQQIRFWAGAPLPLVALVDSGGKSLHGWVRINAANADDWTRRVEGKLFAILTAMGVDSSCKNEARLSRMPGHFRADTNRWQRLLYLNPVGGPIAHE